MKQSREQRLEEEALARFPKYRKKLELYQVRTTDFKKAKPGDNFKFQVFNFYFNKWQKFNFIFQKLEKFKIKGKSKYLVNNYLIVDKNNIKTSESNDVSSVYFYEG